MTGGGHEPPPPGAGTYRVIYADPPWRFATYSDKGKGCSAEAHYDCLTLDQIKAAKPSLEYDGLHGADTGPYTTAMFIEAVYNDLRSAGER